MRQIVLDTETTGLDVSDGNRLIEIGCVELLNRKLTGNHLHLYVNPGRDSEEGALRVHGITTEFLSDKPIFAQVVDDLLAFVKDAEIIIHNAPFDLKFLDNELQICSRGSFTSHVANVIDSLVLAKTHYPGKRNSLDALCTRLEIDNAHRTLHGALLDAQLLAEVYIRLTRGQKTLDMDVASERASHHAAGVQHDYSQIHLPVLQASPEELADHAAMLQAIDKASGGATLWKKLGTNA